jgi:hypothetical protein
VYLALALLGTLAFSTAESCRIDEGEVTLLDSGSRDCTISWLVENTTTANNAHWSSPLRSGMLKIFKSAGTSGNALCFAGPFFQAEGYRSPLPKDAILLKLRI